MCKKKPGIPKQLYSDEEGSANGKNTMALINEHNIKPIQTSTHAHTVEQFIENVRDMLFRRLNGLNHNTNECIKHTCNIVQTYDNTVHNTNQTEPAKAGSKDNFLWVNWCL